MRRLAGITRARVHCKQVRAHCIGCATESPTANWATSAVLSPCQVVPLMALGVLQMVTHTFALQQTRHICSAGPFALRSSGLALPSVSLCVSLCGCLGVQKKKLGSTGSEVVDQCPFLLDFLNRFFASRMGIRLSTLR